MLQYGIWRYADKKLVWSFKQGERVIDDPTVVLAVEARIPDPRERNGATTVFRRLPINFTRQISGSVVSHKPKPCSRNRLRQQSTTRSS